MIAIPAFNENKTIREVIRKVPKKFAFVESVKIVVIDDGSTDDTATVAKYKKVRIVKHLINRGLGAALKTAFIIARQLNADILVTIDADGQHDPKDIRRLIKPIIKRKADVVIGSRLLRYRQMPIDRKAVNYLANIVTFLLTGVSTSDSQSGLRAFNKNAIKKINLITQRMEVSSEIFNEIKKNKLSIKEVGIKPIYTQYSLNKGQSIMNAPNVLLKLFIRLFRQ